MNHDIELLIVNGQIVTPQGLLNGDISISHGKIKDIALGISKPAGVKIIDAAGRYVIPGLVDPHMHLGLRDPRNTIKAIQEEWEPETRGAIYGGVTTILVMLCAQTSYLPIIQQLIPWGNRHSYVNYGFSVVVQNWDHIGELAQLYQNGVIAFKHFFTAFKGAEGEQIGLGYCDEEMLCYSFEEISRLGAPAIAMVHAEDSGLYQYCINKVKASGRDGLEAWADARPNYCEYLRVEFAAKIAYEFGIPLHFVHISTKESLEIIKKYQALGANISAEVVPHTLSTSKHQFAEIGVWGKFVPPLRGLEDISQLWRGINDNIIEHVSTDHCCYSREEKERGGGKFGNIWDPPPGISNVLEHWFPVMITYGVNRGLITIEKFVKICSENNARRFGLYPRKGALIPGADADIVVFDPRKDLVVDEAFYHGRNPDISIHWGERLAGKPDVVISGGRVCIENGQLVNPPQGTFIPAQINHNG